MTARQFYEWQTGGGSTDVHGILMRVASLEDTLAGKLKALGDRERRPSKRQKDLTDVARLIEAHPALRARVPAAVLVKIES